MFSTRTVTTDLSNLFTLPFSLTAGKPQPINHETEQKSRSSYTIKISAPGYSVDQIKVTEELRNLTITGKKVTVLENNHTTTETFESKHHLDKDDVVVDATYTDGVLQVSVSKKASPRTREIPVRDTSVSTESTQANGPQLLNE